MASDDPDRFHSLDNLRAIMMWLGIVIHALSAYLTVPHPFIPFRDITTTPLADLLGALIHAFRMPVFFMVAGFLALMLLERRGAGAFVRHRVLRLALPFAVFWPFLWVATGLASVAFLNRMVHGRWGLDDSVVPPGRPRAVTMHLWFLWMLFWFSMATGLLARLPGARAALAEAGRRLAVLGRAWWGFLPLTVPAVVASIGYPRGLLTTSTEFLMPWNEWLYNGVYYVFGLVLWAYRDSLLPHYRRHWRRYALAGLGAFLACGAVDKAHGPPVLMSLAYGSLAWLWGFAWLGVAQVVLGRRHAVLAYLADSAYWVYLMHLPLTVAIAAVLYGEPLPAVLKIAINIALTTVACLASYQLLVRHTWVSVLLNGKRHPRPGAPPAAQAAA